MNHAPVRGGPLSEDVHGNLVGDSLYYSDQTEKPVAYLRVIRDQTVLGYLWASDEDQAAGYIPRSSAGDDALNTGVAWSQRLREAKARGLTPAQALAELTCFVGNARIGRASWPDVRMSESLDILRALGAE